jgi:hypothetical protein
VPDDDDLFAQRLRESNALAATLVGLTAAEACDVASAQGFQPQVIPPDRQAVTADLRSNRIRLVVDGSGRVTRAWGG